MRRASFVLALLVAAAAMAGGFGGSSSSSGSTNLTAVTTAVSPSTDNAVTLGDATHRWSNAFAGIFTSGAFTAPASTGLTLMSNVANTGSNVGTIIDTGAVLSGSTVLLSVRNHGTEVFNVGRQGDVVSTVRFAAPAFADPQGVGRFTPVLSFGAGTDGNTYNGRAQDSSTDVAHRFGNLAALTDANAKLFVFFSDAESTPKITGYASGALQQATETLKTCASGTEGAISRDTAAGGTTGHRTRLCICTSDGAGTPAYKWQNMGSASLGTTTTCPD